MVYDTKMDMNEIVLDVLTVGVAGILSSVSIGGYYLVLVNFIHSLDYDQIDTNMIGPTNMINPINMNTKTNMELNDLITMTW